MHITYGDRKFSFKCETKETLEVWFSSLKILKTWNEELIGEEEKQNIVSSGSKNLKTQKSKWKMKNVDESTIKAIVNEKESTFPLKIYNFFINAFFFRNFGNANKFNKKYRQ